MGRAQKHPKSRNQAHAHWFKESITVTNTAGDKLIGANADGTAGLLLKQIVLVRHGLVDLFCQ